MNEGAIINRLQQRDLAAFNELVTSWKDRIYNTALGIVQHEQDAADITQEVFLSAWRSVHKFQGSADIGTWLYRIAVNKALDHLRQMKRNKRLGWISGIWGADGRIESEVPDFIHPGVKTERKQEAAILFSAIRKLPDQQRVSYSLQKVEGLSISEIAMILELSEGAVESLLQRAKNNLRKSLANYYQNNRYEQ